MLIEIVDTLIDSRFFLFRETECSRKVVILPGERTVKLRTEVVERDME